MSTAPPPVSTAHPSSEATTAGSARESRVIVGSRRSSVHSPHEPPSAMLKHRVQNVIRALASLIERETGSNAESSKIARVIYNRLAENRN